MSRGTIVLAITEAQETMLLAINLKAPPGIADSHRTWESLRAKGFVTGNYWHDRQLTPRGKLLTNLLVDLHR